MASTNFVDEETKIEFDWANDVNKATYHPVNKAAAKLLPVSKCTTLYITSQDGRGNLWRAVTGAAPGTYSDDGGAFCGTVFIPTGGDGSTAWVRDYSGGADTKWYGVTGNGVTDDSTAVMNAIDANLGKKIIFTEGTFLLAGILLDGATYNDTEIVTDGGILKLAPDGGASNFGGTWTGILVKDCDNVTVDVEWDGNRSAMTAREQIICVGIAGATNTKIPRFVCNEIQGDGIYISQSNWTANSTTPAGVHIGEVIAVNSTNSGRNAVTIASVKDCHINSIYSYQIGGLISGFTMPGGLDIEPNFGYQTVKHVVIDSVDITTAGTGGASVLGKAITNDATRDWNCTDIMIKGKVLKTGTSGAGLSANTFSRFTDLNIDLDVSYETIKGQGVSLDFGDRVNGRIVTKNTTSGTVIGLVEELRDFDLHCVSNDYSVSGIRTCNLTRGTIRGRVYGATLVTGFAIQCHDQGRGGITQTSVNYEIDAPFDGNNSRAFRNEAGSTVSYSDCSIRNCDYTGYTSPAVTIDAEIPRSGVRGLNYASAMPSSGTWHIGDIVYNTGPVIDASSMIQLGWSRLTTGTGVVSGTDWAFIYTSHVSPAT